MTPAEHDQQRNLVLLSTRLSPSRAERRQEAATVARLYPSVDRRVVALPVRPPEPPRAA